MIKIYIYLFIWSMLLGFLFISMFKRLSIKFPKLLSNGIPMIGGLSIGLAFLITLFLGFSLYSNLTREIKGIILASLFILLTGVYDDLKELSIFGKFLVQIIAASILVIFGIKTQIVNLGEAFNLLITFLWVIGITNAFNHLDIIDGLSGGVGFIAGVSFLVISILNSEVNVSIINLAFLGALLSFLFHNLPPAKIYLGNCGSHFLGFILSAQALLISYAPLERKVALLTPLLILGYPIYDTSFLIFMRLKNKRPIFKKSNDHLALRFLRKGYPINRVIVYLYLLTFFFCIGGIMVSQLPNLLATTVIIFMILIIFILTLRFLKNP